MTLMTVLALAVPEPRRIVEDFMKKTKA